MAEFSGGQERLLKQLISTFRCHVCRRTFEQDHVRIAARQEKVWIVSVRCSRCRNQQMFCVVPKEDESVAPFRDLTSDEEQEFGSLPALSSDDVLDMHEFLSEFNGDFKGLFAGR